MGVASLRGRVAVETPPWLAAGDLACIGLFVLAGEFRHYSAARALVRAPETALPFVLGWAAVATVVGAYAADALAGAGRAAVRALVAWIGTALVGQALRGTDLFHGGVSPAFLAVSVIIGGLLLVAWRAAAAAARGRVTGS